jgi:hypothetical protein
MSLTAQALLLQAQPSCPRGIVYVEHNNHRLVWSVIAAIAWEPVAGIAGGIFLIVLGVLSRTGRYRRWESWYRNGELPLYLRNLAFAMVPFGISVLALMVGALIAERNRGLAGGFVGLTCLAFGVGLAFLRNPPRWLKPKWIRNEEDS